MDFALLPPEINSGRLYAGPGSQSMLAAAAAWDDLATELYAAASSSQSVLSGLTAGPWLGPSSADMTVGSMAGRAIGSTLGTGLTEEEFVELKGRLIGR